MEGMILAAGLGTRLRPLTNDRPKAMIEVGGMPLLEHVILKMKAVGINRIVVNTHYFADMVKSFLKDKGYLERGIVISDESDELMDTGGGLLKARPLFTPGEDVLIHNVDICSHLDLNDLITVHAGRYATLAVRESVPGRGLRFNGKGVLKGWENSLTGDQKVVDDEFYSAQSYSFCGIHVVSSDFMKHIEGKGCFSIIDEYLLQAKKHEIRMYNYRGFFMDLGTPEAVEQARKMLS